MIIVLVIEAKDELDDEEEECVKYIETLSSKKIYTTIKELIEDNFTKNIQKQETLEFKGPRHP